MRPILWHLEVAGWSVTLHSYGTLMVLAWVASIAVSTLAAHRLGLPWRRVLLLLGLSLGAGVVGARLFDLWIAWDFYAGDSARILALEFSGFSLYGGLLVSGLTGLALTGRLSVPVWRLADATVPGMAVGILLMRTGCLLNGCCFGRATGLPWGVTYPEGSPVWAHQFLEGETGLLGLMGLVNPVHPTQAYEALGAVAFFAVAIVLMRRKVPDGIAFLMFGAGFTAVRLGNGMLRARQSWITAPEWFYPVFYTLIALVFLGLTLYRTRGPRPRGVADPWSPGSPRATADSESACYGCASDHGAPGPS